MTGPMLESNFYLPRPRPGAVSRARLLDVLDRGTSTRLTLVSAPAGFARTTLVHRSGLVPRGMAVLGLVGGVGICLSGAAVLFGLTENGSPLQLAASLPEFFWELSLGIYLVVRGFKPSALTSERSNA